jgi:hypothetical protein
MPKAVVAALLRAGRGRHGNAHRHFMGALNSLRTVETVGAQATTSRAAKCGMSVGQLDGFAPTFAGICVTLALGLPTGSAHRECCPFPALSEQEAPARCSNARHKAKVQNRSILRTETRDSTNRRNATQTLPNACFSAYEPGGRRFESCRARQIIPTKRLTEIQPSAGGQKGLLADDCPRTAFHALP